MFSADFGKTAQDYRRHRPGFPPDFFARVAAYGIGVPGQRILDVGTGTGTLAREFAWRGCRVIGLDPSEPMLAQARQLDAELGVNVDYRVGKAEATGLAGANFDVVTAGQCWHWFQREQAAAEVMRLLRPGGVLAIAHFDWLPQRGNVVSATEALILKYNPQWPFAGGRGLSTQWFVDLADGGFVGIESFTFDLTVRYTREGWRGRIRASAGVAASLPPEQVAAFDAEHAALLAAEFPEEPLLIPHRVFLVLGRKPY